MGDRRIEQEVMYLQRVVHRVTLQRHLIYFLAPPVRGVL
jgi:hypothetical protein